MKYFISINQKGIVEAGLHEKIDLTDLAILDYFRDWLCTNKKTSLEIEDRTYVWINFSHLLSNMPLLRITSKAALTKRFIKLQANQLIHIHKTKNQKLFICLTDLCISACCFADTVHQSEQHRSPKLTVPFTTVNSTVHRGEQHPIDNKGVVNKRVLNKEKDFCSISEETLQATTSEDTCLSEQEKAFEKFWRFYPSRNGKKLHKADAKKLFMRLKSAEIALILTAVGNYSVSKTVTDGFAKDAVRFIKNDFWEEWLEPEEQTKKGGNNEQRFAFTASV